MKARVKATGEIVEVEYNRMLDSNGEPPYVQCDENGNMVAQYLADQLSWDVYEPDYWEKLLHQYAGMAMQGILANYGVEPLPDDAAHDAYNYAHALVEMMKGSV